MPITSSDGIDYYFYGGIDTLAQANWLFQPTDFTQLTLSLSQKAWYFSEQYLDVMLSDVTVATTLLDFQSVRNNNNVPDGVNNIYSFSLNPNDQYQLFISSQSHISAADSQESHFQQVTASLVPEPSAFCLFSLAFVGFVASRKSLRIGQDGSVCGWSTSKQVAA